jgi:hypothetical protein
MQFDCYGFILNKLASRKGQQWIDGHLNQRADDVQREGKGYFPIETCPSLSESATLIRPAPHYEYLHFSRNPFHKAGPGSF